MYKKLFIWGNVLLFILFMAAIFKDLAGPFFPNHWAWYQRKYRELQAAEETNPDSKAGIMSRPIEIKQIMATDLDKVDRCTSCHQGMDSIATPTLLNSFTENP